MKTSRASWSSLGHWASFLCCLLCGTRIAEAAADDVLLVFCRCPFGYYQASRFPVLLQFTPPCGEIESTQSQTICGRWKTYGLKCVRCHANCFGCGGPTDAHCDTCAKELFNASYLPSESVSPRLRDSKSMSSAENLQFFNDDDWKTDLLDTEAPAAYRREATRNIGGERHPRSVSDAQSLYIRRDIATTASYESVPVVTVQGYSFLEAPLATNVPDEEAVDDRPTNADGELFTNVPTQLTDFIEDEELIPLTTAVTENALKWPDDKAEKYDDTTGANMDSDDKLDSGSGEVAIDEDERGQLAFPSIHPPTHSVAERHRPSSADNYWHPDTLHPAPVKRSGGTTDKILAENVRMRTESHQEPSSLPTPAALSKPTSTQATSPEDLVGLPPTRWYVEKRSNPLSTSATSTDYATKTTRGSSYNDFPTSGVTAKFETSTSYLHNRTVPTVRTTRRRTTISTLPPSFGESTSSGKSNSTERQATTKKRTRKTTVQPTVTESTQAVGVATANPTYTKTRSAATDVLPNTDVISATSNEEKKSTETVTYETKLPVTAGDPVSPSEVTNVFRCVGVCPEGTYPDTFNGVCLMCDNKCQTCVGPSFMNCTSCASNAVQAARSLPNAIGYTMTVTCLSGCPGNHFVYNGTCTPCHAYCNGCYGFGHSQCLACRYGQAPTHKTQTQVFHHTTPPTVCAAKEDDPESQLELILPLAFISFLVLVTVVFCIRWNCKIADICIFNPELCNKLKKKEDKENLSKNLSKKLATSGKNRNEYSPSPPNGMCPKCQFTTSDDGYELPLHPSTGSTSNYTPGSINSTSSSANHTMIKPRRNDPLPLTPIELDAIHRREKSSKTNVYKNIPQTSKAAVAIELTNDVEQIPGTSLQSEDASHCKGKEKQHIVLTDTEYANSEVLYANC